MASRGTYDRHCKVTGFQEIVQKQIEQYIREIQDDIPDIVEKTGKQCVAHIKAYVWAAGINDRTYGSSWKVKVIDRNKFLGTFITVHSPKKYSIAHLLEHGHDIKNKKGQVLGSARAFPHLRYAEADAEMFLENSVKRLIEEKT